MRFLITPLALLIAGVSLPAIGAATHIQGMEKALKDQRAANAEVESLKRATAKALDAQARAKHEIKVAELGLNAASAFDPTKSLIGAARASGGNFYGNGYSGVGEKAAWLKMSDSEFLAIETRDLEERWKRMRAAIRGTVTNETLTADNNDGSWQVDDAAKALLAVAQLQADGKPVPQEYLETLASPRHGLLVLNTRLGLLVGKDRKLAFPSRVLAMGLEGIRKAWREEFDKAVDQARKDQLPRYLDYVSYSRKYFPERTGHREYFPDSRE